jgi:hypothetical protein
MPLGYLKSRSHLHLFVLSLTAGQRKEGVSKDQDYYFNFYSSLQNQQVLLSSY